MQHGGTAVYHLDERLFGITQAISNATAITVEVVHVEAYSCNLLQCFQHIIRHYRRWLRSVELVITLFQLTRRIKSDKPKVISQFLSFVVFARNLESENRLALNFQHRLRVAIERLNLDAIPR